MKRLRIIFGIIAMVLACATAQAQFGKVLGKAIENAAKNATVHKAQQKTDEAVSKGIDKATNPNTYKGDGKEENKGEGKGKGGGKENASEGNSNSGKASAPQGMKGAEAAYAKSDFVPGDKIIFEDSGVGEKQGEFPSRWDLHSGNADNAAMNGENVIHIDKVSEIFPLMKNPKAYLPDVYTVEFDIYNFVAKSGNGGNDWYIIDFMDINSKSVYSFRFKPDWNGKYFQVDWTWKSPAGEGQHGSQTVATPSGGFVHTAVSFNQRALKIYFDGQRVVNIPNCAKATWFSIRGDGSSSNVYFIKNIRIAEGAVPLYDRLASEGKIITYGITFDVGKSTIKPESVPEINRIVQLMQDNPDLKFSVEGHTDNTGGAASNQTLSEARSKAVMDKMVEMGISKDRLKAAGKGQTSPIADNSTDEGRAKNRRVEFVKI